MPGAGSSTVAFALESGYNGGVGGTPTYYNLGPNVQVETAEVTRNLLEQSLPGQVEDADALAQRLDGQLGVSAVVNSDDYHRLIFNDGFTGFTNGRAQSAEWYLGADLIGPTVERQIQGWAPQSASVQYNGTTDAVRVTLQGFYATEDLNTSITPGSITNLTPDNAVPGHGATLDIDGTTISRLQSATVSFENIARPQFDSNSPIAVDAVTGNISQSVSMTGVVTNTNQLELAYGSSSATSIQDYVDSVPITLALDHDGGAVADYTLETCKVDGYNWNDLVNDDNDLNESIDWFATGVTASDPTA
jgi:hypothetical protein